MTPSTDNSTKHSRMMFTFNILLMVLIPISSIVVHSLPESAYQVNTLFSVSIKNFPLRNIEFDDQTSSFYVSGKNVLYKFDMERSCPIVTEVTGPNYTCFTNTELSKKYCGDDENIVMIVTSDSLITCSTLYGGRCIKREKSTLKEEMLSSIYLVPNTTVSAHGILVNVTFGKKQSKQLLLFAKAPAELPPSSTQFLERVVIFSTTTDLQVRTFYSNSYYFSRESIFDLLIMEKFKNIVNINYRAIFENDDFVFILYNQNSEAKLSKLCKTIAEFNPLRVYEDIPISCKDEKKNFTTVVHGKFVMQSGTRYLAAVFSNSAGIYALCVFSETELNDAFLKSRRHRFGCLKEDHQPADMIFEGEPNVPDCRNRSELPEPGFDDFVNWGDFCNDVIRVIPQFGPFIGLLSLVRTAVYRTEKRITTIGDHVDNGFVLLYLGTEHGSIVKTYMDEALQVHFIEEIRIDRSRIKSVTSIKGILVILTENKIVNITSKGCEKFSGSCKECMRAKSAQCGWCISTERCTERLECITESDFWLSSLKKQCLKIQLNNDFIKIDSQKKINLTVNFLPNLITTRNLTCLIDGISVITYQGIVGLKCEINLSQSSQTVEPGDKQLKGLLEGRVIAETTVLFYRCTDINSCVKCLENARMSCFWCSFDGMCSQTRGNCRYNSTVTDIESCPVIVTNTVRISSGREEDLTFLGRNLKSEFNYQCIIDVAAYAAVFNITTNSSLVCKKVKGEYPEKTPKKDFKVLFKYGPNEPSRVLDSFGNETIISVYKCEYLSPDRRDCSRCQNLKLSEGYNCVWCGERYGCVESESCTVPQTCSAPEIDKIVPTDGPIGGGTLITIEGRNLGASLAEVKNATVAGVKCSNVQFLQTSLQCTTGAMINGPISGDIMVLVNRLWSTTTVQFVYKAPEITGIYPESIIKSGGRHVWITGQNINIGNRKYEVILSPLNTFGRNKSCVIDVDESTVGEIVCTPEKSDVLGKHIVQVVFDSNTTVKLRDMFLTYLPNPLISGTTPPSTNLRSIMSGGLGFLVHGQGFVDVIENALTSLSESSVTGPKCSIQNTTVLSCTFPKLEENESRTRKKRDIAYQTIVIHIDGFSFVISQTVIYVSDPVFFELNGNRPYEYDPSSENRHIFIKGRQMNIVTDLEDYIVLIGSGDCMGVQLLNDTLICLPPYKEPTPRLYEDKLYIRVKVGNINTVIGVVKYTTRYNTLFTVLACFASLLFIVCAAFLFFRQRKNDCFKITIINKTGIPMENVQRASGHDILINIDHSNANTTATFESHVNENILYLLKNKGLLISKENLEINCQIGKGNFGVVYEGSFTNTEKDLEIKVAVKTLHQSNPREIDVDNFLDEAIRMLEFNHPNVMTLIGICLSLDEMPLVVLPYMKHGDLLCYIRNDKNMLTLRNLIEFATDISRGMEYLSIQKVVHRDLAARNCMLSECYRAVVADFGLSRDIYEKDYYSSNNRKTRLPVKWMAPENLEKGIYSPKSDVWSFGVVMWELLTRGSKPYPEVDGWDMLKYLKDSRRLPKPAKCPELLYTKMINCWNLDPDQRPTFSDLAEQLSEIVSPTDDEFETHSDYQSLQNTYINTGIEGYLELEN